MRIGVGSWFVFLTIYSHYNAAFTMGTGSFRE